GVHLAVLSNTPDGQAVDVVHTFFGKELFDYVQGQREGIPRKPDPAGVFLIMDRTGSKASECLYIGDSDVDMHTGKNAGMKTIGVSWGFRSKIGRASCRERVEISVVFSTAKTKKANRKMVL